VRKALLAGAVTPDTYGRAFGFERMMDTIGAIVGPATAFALLNVAGMGYRELLLWTLVPGLAAAFLMAVVVEERARTPVGHVGFGESLRALPRDFRRFLLAVGLFGMGDFAHSLLILLALQKLTPSLGAARAAGLAAGLYVLHNLLYAAFSMIAGSLADRLEKRLLLAGGYLLAAVMAGAIIFLPLGIWTLAAVFALGGVYIAFEETLEDSFCAELVDKAHHGMAFGTLATVNGIGDFASSLIVGLLWSAAGISVAFGYSAVLFACGAAMILRTGAREHPDS
jgi:MFS family permease